MAESHTLFRPGSGFKVERRKRSVLCSGGVKAVPWRFGESGNSFVMQEHQMQPYSSANCLIAMLQLSFS